MPVLMVDEQPLLQSLAIARYAARQADLVPEDSLDAARCDALVDTTSEIMGEVYGQLCVYMPATTSIVIPTFTLSSLSFSLSSSFYNYYYPHHHY